MKRVRSIMTMNPACCVVETRLVDVARLMIEHDCGEIPVVNNHEEKKLIGVITDRDICIRAVALGLNPAAMKAKDCMTSPAITVEIDTPLDECIKLMEDKQIRRMPVVDSKGSCCGMISLADIARKTEEWTTGAIVKNISKPHEASI
ncbi:MAG: CBS domain-containing protein [Bacteriovorax sp.]|jgi:CBS domain-containing protein